MTRAPASSESAQRREAGVPSQRTPEGELDELLLHYQASSEPAIIKSTDEGVRIDVTIKKRHLNSKCERIVFRFPVGATANALITAADAAKISPIRPAGWTLESTGKAGEFEAVRGDNAGQAVTFGWKTIKLNGKPGYFTIAVAETAGRGSEKPAERTADLPRMQKVSPEVYFSDFKPDKPSIPCGAGVKLSWSGKTTTKYEVRYDDKTEPVAAGMLEKTIENIRHTTTFLLIAESVNHEKHYYYQSLTVPVQNPEQSVGALEVEKTAAVLGTAPHKYRHNYEKDFVAYAPTDGFLLLWPSRVSDGSHVAKVIATVYRKAAKSHVVRRTVDERAEGEFSLPSAMCVPLPRGAKVVVTRTGSACNTEELLWIPGGKQPLATVTTPTRSGRQAEASPSGILFDYRYQPNVAVISTSETVFEFIVDTGDPKAACDKVTFSFPAGDKADDLAAEPSGNTSKKQWTSFVRDPVANGKIPFVAKPPANVFAKTPERLSVTDVVISAKEGPACISVTETRNGQESPARLLPVYKSPPDLEMSDLAPDKPSIPKPGKMRVSWKSQKMAGVGFFLKWGDAQEIPVDAYQNYDVGPLHRTTAVQLTARRLSDNRDLKVLTTTIDVAHPDITVQDLTVTDGLDLFGPTQSSNKTTLAQPVTATAATDGILVVSALHQPRTKAAALVSAEVTPREGQAYGARTLAATGLDTLQAGFALPVPSGASVTLKKESGGDLRDGGEITWLPIGSGPLTGLFGMSDESTFVSASEDDAQPGRAGYGPPPLTDFRPDKLTVPNGKPVKLTWRSATDKHLTLLYPDSKNIIQRTPVTGKTEQVVEGIHSTTAFTLLASTLPSGDGDVLGAVTTTVTVMNPTATYRTLAVDGGTTAFGPPKHLDYEFTADYSFTASTDGFLVGWVLDSAAPGSRVTAEVRHSDQTTHTATASTGTLPPSWEQEKPAVVPDNFFVPIPKGATLTIKKATKSSGERSCALRWIPIGERKSP
ncbi:hypothetical protein BS329_34000 [Amycolatopsis coloradensis]|uniref:Uncharacterized protein n=1 Tax=Amycolatopsis coloradensis TaxID=76021 RepID=A0A1R0KI47_9PSEU|nr:hypothetical protein [Amycolatopsis coloradensis]OLZ45438.1 hypothetical protein BS329_34000 [Amycolatopsis coloradensis]